MAQLIPQIILRCPKCTQRAYIRTLARSGGQRKCYRCGYIGDPKEFEEKINPGKKKK